MQRVQLSLGSWVGRFSTPAFVKRAFRVTCPDYRRKQRICCNTGRLRFCRCYSRADGDEEDEVVEPIEGTLEEILLESPAVKSAIAKITAASERYQELLAKRDELVKRQAAISTEQQQEMDRLTESRIMAEAEVEASQLRVEAAKLRVIDAVNERNAIAEAVEKGMDQLESAKALVVAALGGIVAILPIILVEQNDILYSLIKLLTATASSGVFGITYRYAIDDGSNVQLKIGTVSAFWIVSSLSILQTAMDSHLGAPTHFDLRFWGIVGELSAQWLIVFLASTVAIEFSFRSRFIQYTRHATEQS